MFGLDLNLVGAFAGAGIGILGAVVGTYLGTSRMLKEAQTKRQKNAVWLAVALTVCAIVSSL